MAVQPVDFIPATDEFATENIESTLDSRPTASASPIKSGWAAADDLSKPKEYTKDFVVTEEETLVKFLDEGGPYAIYASHWLDEKKEGQKSFVCLGTGCPICLKFPDNRPAKKYAFSVALIASDSTVTLTRLHASSLLFKSLHAAEHGAAGPLTKNYWSISRRGSYQSLVFSFTPVKGRDLMEDHGVDEEKVKAQLATMSPFEASSIRRLTIEELTEVVNAL
jgi:hypothetical protein